MDELSREQIEDARAVLRVIYPDGGNALCDMALAYLDAKADAGIDRAEIEVSEK